MGDKVAVTASTGIAGQQIGGSTIHSFAGIGLGNKAVPELVKEMYPSGRNRWTQVKVLILDEGASLADGKHAYVSPTFPSLHA